MWASSLTDSTSKGKPDIEAVDLTTRLHDQNDTLEVTTKPVIFDGDTGGKVEHFGFTVRTLERLGISAVIIEDKVGLRQNSLFGTDAVQTQDTIEGFQTKIRAGKEAQITRDFMVISRCESLIAGKPVEDALERCHALSFWWFDELDGRGNNTLLENLREHFDTVRYIVTTGKPVEPNVPHHFAFRGGDDITFIVSGFLAAKAIKLMGASHMVLQDMLNTPKYTWGVQDLAKGRVLIKLVRELEDSHFKVSLQTRGGLDYFAPDLEYAKVQLAAVTCMMDDLEPDNDNSPEIIHVVNYSEAVRLATPPIIKESIKITLAALHQYRFAKKMGVVPNMKHNPEVQYRYEALLYDARAAIRLLEENIPNLYTPEGFEKVFKEGFLAVPYLMDQECKWPKATMWKTAIKNGGIAVVDDDGKVISTEDRYHYIIDHMER